jgi:hypothetical protein
MPKECSHKNTQTIPFHQNNEEINYMEQSGFRPITVTDLVMSPRGGSTPRQTDWLTVSCNVTLTLTVTERSKTWTVVARSNAGIVGSNPTQGMDICVGLFCVCVVLCVGSGLVTGWSPVQEVLPTVYRNKKRKKAGKVQQKYCRSIDGVVFRDKNRLSGQEIPNNFKEPED